MDLFPGQMSINLGSGDMAVSQELLDGAQVCPPAEEVGGEAVAQGMGGYPPQACLFGVFLQDLPESLAGQALAPAVQEEGLLPERGLKLSPALPEIVLQGAAGLGVNGDDP